MRAITMILVALLLTQLPGPAHADPTMTCSEVAPDLKRCDYADTFSDPPRRCGDERNIAYEGTTLYAGDAAAVDTGDWRETSATTPYTADTHWIGIGLGALDGDGVYMEVTRYDHHCRLGSGEIVNLYTVGFWHSVTVGDDGSADAQSDLLP